MKIIFAPDSYKGSLSSIEVASTIRRAFKEVMPTHTYVTLPMADGGEGFLNRLLNATNGKRWTSQVTDALGRTMDAPIGVLGDNKTAVIEMASIAGLPMLKQEERNPLYTSTLGIGEAMVAAMDKGYRKFVIGLGGSATNDGGMGMLQALGVKMLDQNGEKLLAGGASLKKVETIDYTTIDERIRHCDIQIACDVDNPLAGEDGASIVFGPQKGVSKEQIIELEQGMNHYAAVVERKLDKFFKHIPGAGAAGGLAFGFLTIGATIQSGANLVGELVGLDEELTDADLIITGEGKSDRQTIHGKVPYYIAKQAKNKNVPCLLLSGSLGDGMDELSEFFTSCHSILQEPVTLERALQNAEHNLYVTSKNLARFMKQLTQN